MRGIGFRYGRWQQHGLPEFCNSIIIVLHDLIVKVNNITVKTDRKSATA